MLPKDYNRLISFAKEYFKHKHHIDPNDIVNDVVLDLLNDGKEIFYDEAIRLIKSHHSANEKPVSALGKDFSKHDIERVCKDCKELLPVGAFYLLKQKDRMAISSYCKECHKKRSLVSHRKPENKSRIKLTTGKYLKTVWAKESEFLTDRYIIKCIVDASYRQIKKGLTTREDVKNGITKKMIEEYRQKKIMERKSA